MTKNSISSNGSKIAVFLFCYINVFQSEYLVYSASIEQNKHPTKKDMTVKGKTATNKSFVLVPPPPPEQPSFLEWSNGISSSLGLLNIGLLNEEELKQKLSRLKTEIADAQGIVEDNDTELNEAKTKADSFKSLYVEGVVSRKELDTANKNVTNKERLVKEAKGKLEDLKVQENAILRRLAGFKKNPKSKWHSTKSIKQKSEKKK